MFFGAWCGFRSFRRFGENTLAGKPFPLRSRPSITLTTGLVRESQGGDPAGVAGWGGGLYFFAPGGILIIRRAAQRGKGLGERY